MKNINQSFKVNNISDILNVEKTRSDTSTKGKMRDSYAKQVFNIINLMKLINNGENEVATFFSLIHVGQKQYLMNESILIPEYIF